MPQEDFKPPRDENAEPEQFRKIFIGGLASVTDEDGLKTFYGKWGEIVDVVVMRDPHSKRSRGFGFISYSSSESVDKAMENRPHIIDDKKVDPKRAVPREDSTRGQKLPSTPRLYVSGVREGHTEEIIRDYFETYGKVEKVEILLDKATGKPRGFCFVTFDDYDPVDKCVLLKHHLINGHRCDVKKGLSKIDMAKFNDQHERDRAMRGDRFGQRGGRESHQNAGFAGGYGWGGPMYPNAWSGAPSHSHGNWGASYGGGYESGYSAQNYSASQTWNQQQGNWNRPY